MTRCATTSALVGEPMAGSAPQARTWLAIEQSGPWGREALTESHLDPAVGAELGARTVGTGVKVVLIRRPGRHADAHQAPRQRVAWIAHSAPDRGWLRRLDFHDAAELLELDFAALGTGTEPSVGERDHQPLLLVCTNAKRDQCCAIQGRPAAQAAADAYPGRVWECSHLGGHRFAATAVVLPYGFVHGRLDLASTAALLKTASSGRVDLGTLRGRSCWSGPAQAAEAGVRTELGLDGLADVIAVRTTAQGLDRWTAEVVLASGVHHVVTVHEVVDDSVNRPESCVKPAIPLRAFAVGPLGAVKVVTATR